MKKPLIKELYNPQLLNMASTMATRGQLKATDNGFVYLDIDDQYIHDLFPLLNDAAINKPDYFGKGMAGAHITVIYPEENKKIFKEDLNQEHRFIIKNLVTALIGTKTYYALLVESQSLLKIRRKYALSDLLCFKGYAIGFHITIGKG